MPSVNAKAVAREIIQTVRKGQKVNKGKIIRKHGYSKSVSLRPSKVTDTESFREEIEPIVKQMERERQAILKALPQKRNNASYRDLVDAADKLTKNIQLLSGKATEIQDHRVNVDDEKYARIVKREARALDGGSS